MSSNLKFITVRDTSGRASSFGYDGKPHYQPAGTLKVVGNLEHDADIRPDTEADRLAWIAWLNRAEVIAACNPDAMNGGQS